MKRMIRTATEVDSIDVAKINEFNKRAFANDYYLTEDYAAIVQELEGAGYEKWTSRKQFLQRLDPEKNTAKVNPLGPNSVYNKLRRSHDPAGIVVVDPKRYWERTKYWGSQLALEYKYCYLYAKR